MDNSKDAKAKHRAQATVTMELMRDTDLEDFRGQCERSIERTVADRMRYGFNYVYKPVLDDAKWRSF